MNLYITDQMISVTGDGGGSRDIATSSIESVVIKKEGTTHNIIFMFSSGTYYSLLRSDITHYFLNGAEVTPVPAITVIRTTLQGILPVGVTQIMEVSVTAAANAGLTTLATITTQPCLLKSIVIHSDGATTADLTSAAVKGGASQVKEFISAATAAKANIDAANEQVSWTGAARLPATTTIVMDLQGTGATAVDLTVTIEYIPCVNGGYLA
ncbi:MAG: hypothetical protein H8E51_08575 [Bacteroidetes bacterium]|nr:hypothetical protein [Bacteroidota bacterium]